MRSQPCLITCLLLNLHVIGVGQTFNEKSLSGYLTPEQYPDGSRYLPAPASVDDPFFVDDFMWYRWGVNQRQGERLKQALADGDRSLSNMLQRFAPAIGFTLTPDNAPITCKMMARLKRDSSNSDRLSKSYFGRKRPYQQFLESTPCPEYETPEYVSYPSSHSVLGWLDALLLSSFDSENAADILRVGYEIGLSRVILGFHYQSDVEAGRLVAAAAFARLLADDDFMRDYLAAREEYRQLKARMYQRPLVVLFDNDVHCALEGYPYISGLRDAIAAADTAFTALVSCGDFIQGKTLGLLSRGGAVADILNAAHYDVLTLGNHEFDYLCPRLFELTTQIEAPITCFNFTKEGDDVPLYLPYVMRRYGAHRVAFLGMLTPTTIHDEMEAFADITGRHLYAVHEDDFYTLAQQTINSARTAGADYVVVLSHLGERGDGVTSHSLLANTTGINVLLDGHTHSVVPYEEVVNAAGIPVPLAETGSFFANVGKLVIDTTGHCTLQLIPTQEITYKSESVSHVVDSIYKVYDDVLFKTCAQNDQTLIDADDTNQRLVRTSETNLTDFVADAMRYTGQTQLAVVNGGGIRTSLKKGKVTYKDLIDVSPFENALAVVEITGERLLTLMESASQSYPKESGFFLHPAGFRFTIDPKQSPCVTDVQTLEADGTYKPLDPKKTYTLTITTYLINKYGTILRDVPILRQNFAISFETLYQYVTKGLHGHIGKEYAQPQGRITVR